MMTNSFKRRFSGIFIVLALLAGDYSPCKAQIQPVGESAFLIVLGTSQDGGTPQAGSHDHPGWKDPSRRRLATSLGIVDPETGKTWMFEATPDFRQQWYELDRARMEALDSLTGSPSDVARTSETTRPTPDGIFLTHAHIGHYAGLMFLGHESMGTNGVTVYAMDQMADFLSLNGPWDQLVRLNNIVIRKLLPSIPVTLTGKIRVIPFLVPHRQEYSEVVGYRIEGPNRTVVFIPDIDSWDEWDTLGHRLEAILETTDIAYIDGTFFANGEIPGRDMSGFPHPFITTTMDRLSSLPAVQKAKIRFIHLNHTNPASVPDSADAIAIREQGFNVASPLEKILL
jgi:pyrroloquinoline quinone biosynthesis protein B